MASEKILNQKKEEVTKLANKIKEAKLVLLTDYRGINVEDVTGLRAELRKTNAEYTVIKNNITRRALEEAGITGLEDKLVGPTAVIMPIWGQQSSHSSLISPWFFAPISAMK